MMSESRTRFSVRWQCGSSSTAIGTFVPTIARTRSMRSPRVVIAVGDHRPVQAEQHAVDRHRGGKLGEDLVAHRLVVALVRRADGSAQKHEPSTSSNPSCRARRRAT
jgi:hypothetical protein